jgi:Tfp pilus assembly PilM family ATPase
LTLAGSGRGARGVGTWLRRTFLNPDWPLSAIEVRAGSVGAVRLQREGQSLALETAASLELPEDALRVSLTEPNILDRGAFRAVLQALLDRTGTPAGGRVAIVLPDPVARLRTLAAEGVGDRNGREAEEMIRFRLQKTLPFDVREARVAWTAAGPGERGPQVLAAAMRRTVLDDYEGAFEAVGLKPGLVELSGLALMRAASRAAEAQGDHLLVNWDTGYVSFVLIREGAPVLVRTLSGEAAQTPEQVAREAGSTVLYYLEKLRGPGLSGATVRSVALAPHLAVGLLTEPLGFTPKALPLDSQGAAAGLDAVPHALAGGVACILGRVA